MMTQSTSAAMVPAGDSSSTTSGYENDAYGWALQQVGALRAARLGDLDLPNLARTLDSLIEQENAKLSTALEQIIEGLLKWDCRPDARNRTWALTVHQQRRRIARQMRRQPGLRLVGPSMIEGAFAIARTAVTRQLELYDDTLPAICPYDWEHLLGYEIDWA